MGQEKAGPGLSTKVGIPREALDAALGPPFLPHSGKAQVSNSIMHQDHLQAWETGLRAPPQSLCFSRSRVGPEDLHPKKLPDDTDATGSETTLGKQLLWVIAVPQGSYLTVLQTCRALFCGGRGRTKLLVPGDLQSVFLPGCFLPVSEESGIRRWQELEASPFPGRPQRSLPSGTQAQEDSGYHVFSQRESLILSGQIQFNQTSGSAFYVPALVWGSNGSRGRRRPQIHKELKLWMAGLILLQRKKPHTLIPLLLLP